MCTIYNPGGPHDGDFFFDGPLYDFEISFNASHVYLRDKLSLAAAKVPPTFTVPDAALYSGNVIGLPATVSDSFFFTAAVGDVPTIYVANATYSEAILTSFSLPFSIDNGGTEASELEGSRNNLQLGSLSVEDTIDSYVLRGVISIPEGGLGIDPIGGLELGSLQTEDLMSIDSALLMSVRQSGTGANNLEEAGYNLQLGSLAYAEVAEPETLVSLERKSGAWYYPEQLGALSELDYITPEAAVLQFTIAQGGTKASDLEAAADNLQLGALAVEDLLDLYLSTPDNLQTSQSGTSATDITNVFPQLQLGAISKEDIIDTHLLFGSLTIATGGTGASNIEIARRNAQTGALATEDYLDSSTFLDSFSIAAGGTGAKDITVTPDNFQLGALGFLEVAALDDQWDAALPIAQGGVVSVNALLENALGALAFQDIVFATDELLTLSVASGGTGATDIEAAGINLQLGSLAQLDVWFLDPPTDQLVLSQGGFGTDTLEDHRNVIQLGALAVEDLALPLDPLQIVAGGTGAQDIEGAALNLQLGSLAYEDYVTNYAGVLNQAPLKFGLTDSSNIEAFQSAFQTGSLAQEDWINYVPDLSLTIGINRGGYPIDSFFAQFGRLATEDIIFQRTDVLNKINIANGGTGGTSISGATNNLQLGAVADEEALYLGGYDYFLGVAPITNGGTSVSEIEGISRSLLLGNLVTEDFVDAHSYDLIFSQANGGTGVQSISDVSFAFQLGSLSTDELATDDIFRIDSVQIEGGGTGSAELETAMVHLQLGSLGFQDIVSSSYLRVTVHPNDGGIGSIDDALSGASFQVGTLAFEDSLSVAEWPSSNALLPIARGGVGDGVDSLQLDSLAYEEWIDGSYNLVIDALTIPSSGTGASEIEKAALNLQLGSLAFQDLVTQYEMGSTFTIRQGALVASTIEGKTNDFQLGSLATVDLLSNRDLYLTLAINQGGLGATQLSRGLENPLTNGAIATEDIADTFSSGFTLSVSNGGFPSTNIEAMRNDWQLGGLATEDQLGFYELSDYLNIVNGGTGAKTIENAALSLQLGTLAYLDSLHPVDIGTLDIPLTQGGLPGDLEARNNRVLQLGALASEESNLQFEYYIDPTTVFSLASGGTSFSEIEGIYGLQLGALAFSDSLASFDIGPSVVLPISQGGTGSSETEGSLRTLSMGAFAYSDYITPSDFYFIVSNSLIQQGLLTSRIFSTTTLSEMPPLQVGSLVTEDFASSSELASDFLLKISQGGTSVSSVGESLFSLGSLAVEDELDRYLVNPLRVANGGLGTGLVSSDPLQTLQLGALAQESIIDFSLVSSYFLLSVSQGGSGTSIEGQQVALQLGSLSLADSLSDQEVVDIFPIASGGTSAATIESAGIALHLDSLAYEDIITSYHQTGLLPISAGGLGASQVEAIGTNLQLGSIAYQDYSNPSLYVDTLPIVNSGTGLAAIDNGIWQLGALSTADVASFSDFYMDYDNPRFTPLGFIAPTVESVATNWSLGILATHDMLTPRELVDVLSITNGGTSAQEIESASVNLQLGSLAFEDFATDLKGLLRSQGSFGSSTDLETAGVTLYVGSIAYEDSVLSSYLFTDALSVAKGGLAARNIEDARRSMQWGSTASDDFLEQHGLISTGGISRGLLPVNQASIDALQLGSLAVEDSLDTYLLRQVILSRGGLSADNLEQAALTLQLGSFAYEEAVDNYMVQLDPVSIEEGGFGIILPATTIPYYYNATGNSIWLADINEMTAKVDTNVGMVAMAVNTPATNLATAATFASSPLYPTTMMLLHQKTDMSTPSTILSLTAYLDPSQEAQWEASAFDYMTFTANDTTVLGGFTPVVGATTGHLSVAFYSNGADYAEYLPKADPAESILPGDIVGVFRNGTVSKRFADPCASSPDAADVASHYLVASTTPTVVGGYPGEDQRHAYVIVAMLGQAVSKVSGKVHQGDLLMPSGLNDGAAKALSSAAFAQAPSCQRSQILGTAWESGHADQVSIKTGVGLSMERFLKPIIQRQQSQIDHLKSTIEQDTLRLSNIRERTLSILQEIQMLRNIAK